MRAFVACQRDGTTVLLRAWDHLEVLVSVVGLAFGVNPGVPVGVGSLSVGRAFDDEGVRAGHGELAGVAGEPPGRGARPAGRTGRFFSVARASIEAILVTKTTSRSREVAQAASTGTGPWRRTRPSSRYTARILVQGSGSSSSRSASSARTWCPNTPTPIQWPTALAASEAS
jgi:hypothetical protein